MNIKLNKKKPSTEKPIFSTARLNCQLVTSADVDFVASLYQSPEVMSHIADAMSEKQSMAAAQRCIDVTQNPSSQDCFWLLVANQNNQPIGTLGLLASDDPHNSVEMGILLDPAAAKSGLATEVISALLPVTFEQMGFDCMYSKYRFDHHAIDSIAKKLNFIRVLLPEEEGKPRQKRCDLTKSRWLVKG